MTIRNDGIVVRNSGILVRNGGIPVRNSGILVSNDGIVVRNGGILVRNGGIAVRNDGIVVRNGGILVSNDGILVSNGEILVSNDGILVSNGKTTVSNDKVAARNRHLKNSCPILIRNYYLSGKIKTNTLKKLFILVLCCFSTIAFAQVVKGRVFDENNKPLYGANIYFDGTSIATISDEKGYFQLPVSGKINASLVFSFIGYQSATLFPYPLDEEIKMVLKPSTNSLKEVVITKSRFTRKQMLKLFREQFLGETKAGKKAVILNENDLDFEYDEKFKVFTASSDKPLIIQNPVLGYEVAYEISDFIVEFKTLSISSDDVYRVLYTGVSRFKETSNSKEVIKERMKSYQGSVLHFFRSLISDKMVENNFILVKGDKQASVTNNFAIKDTIGYKQVTLKNANTIILRDSKTVKTRVLYKILFNQRRNSSVTFTTPVFYVDQYGIHTHVNDILFAGEMSLKRVGDLLPTNYGINEEAVLKE